MEFRLPVDYVPTLNMEFRLPVPYIPTLNMEFRLPVPYVPTLNMEKSLWNVCLLLTCWLSEISHHKIIS